MLDGLLVPLVRSALGFLQALAQSFEQTAHVSRMVTDPELLADNLGNPPARPQLPPEAVRWCASGQKLGQLGALLFAQARRRSGSVAAL